MLMLAAWLLAQNADPLKVEEKSKKLSFEATVAQQEVHEQLHGFIEYVIVFSGGKEYESLFVTSVDPLALYEAMKKIGLKPGQPAREEEEGKRLPPEGDKVKAFVEWSDGGKDRREPIESFVRDVHSEKPMAPLAWVFTGSRMGYDPEKDRQSLQVVGTRNLMSLYQDDGTVLMQNPAAPEDGHSYKANKELLPKEGTKVRIVLEAP